MGPLAGVRIIEIAGLGAGPFCGMMMADMGAEVIRVDRPVDQLLQDHGPLSRNRKSIAIDLKQPAGVDTLLKLIEPADGVFEGFRPGVAERLGFGPEICLSRNPRLVYGRITGWGQDGPLAQAAGHDINYIALSGALAAIGRTGEKPVPPLNLVGDFGGGGLILAFGMVCALLETKKSGKGQIVDASMLDGANALMALFHGFRAMGLFDGEPGTHFFGGAAHYYDTYETRDNKFIAIGSIEPEFYQLLIELLELDAERFSPWAFNLCIDETTRAAWRELKAEVADVFRSKTRDEWCALLEGTDVCFAPVLTVAEATEHPHNQARRIFVEVDGVVQNAPAPRFSRTPTSQPSAPRIPGADTVEILEASNFSAEEIRKLRAAGAVVQAS
jgi:alpha-methylacyl-CoA racemase